MVAFPQDHCPFERHNSFSQMVLEEGHNTLMSFLPLTKLIFDKSHGKLCILLKVNRAAEHNSQLMALSR